MRMSLWTSFLMIESRCGRAFWVWEFWNFVWLVYSEWFLLGRWMGEWAYFIIR